MIAMNNETMINVLYFIKRTVFKGENDSVAELIYVTKETTSSTNGRSHVTPEIIASHIREIPVSQVTEEKLSFEEKEEKVYISEEEAKQLSNLGSVDPAFVEKATLFF
jgi:predicted NUDIX family phosphoesterase